MAKIMVLSLFLLYGALAVPAYAQDIPFGNCSLANATKDTSSLTVNPTSYKASTSYTVTINVTISNTTILFQVIDSTNKSIESGWQDGTPSCNGVYFQISNKTSLTAIWNSTDSTSVTSVTIRAYVEAADKKISKMEYMLAQDVSTKPPAVTSVTSVTTRTTSSAPTFQSSCTILGIIQVMALAFLCHLTS